MKKKYPYSIKILEERVIKEKDMLKIFKKPPKHID